ncbi:MAG: phosphonopyruvate decarboxylase [Clostridia bacterium]|nr:phosphonopyruvate decarboxylase [Clostridia bacterium]
MEANRFCDFLDGLGVTFFTGVPDSILQPFCQCLLDDTGRASRHLTAANEGNAIGAAAGFHLATGNIPCIYMQNSGLGNAYNPLASLLHTGVYAIPAILVIGWRGEPGLHDEPQHMVQGRITIPTLELLGIEHFVLSSGSMPEEILGLKDKIIDILRHGGQFAFVVSKGALSHPKAAPKPSVYSIVREAAIDRITRAADGDIMVSTTGKTSRELYEIREQHGEIHSGDFLTVGSMGHASGIALGLAMHSDHRIWCLDGDGAALMHLGAMATIGHVKPDNLIHVVINNQAHESVGGMSTTSPNADFASMAQACGYPSTRTVSTMEELDRVLAELPGLMLPVLIEVQTAAGSRGNLGRPTIGPVENKTAFMDRWSSNRKR